MRCRLSLGVLFAISGITSAIDSSLFNDDALSSNPSLDLEAPALPSDDLTSTFSSQIESSSSSSLFDQNLFSEASNSNTFESLSSNLNDDTIFSPSSDTVDVNNLLQLADCSTSDNLSLLNKSRVRRGNSPAICDNKANAATSGEGILGGQEDSVIDASIRNALMQVGSDRIENDQNPLCHALTHGRLPWGVCNSGNLLDEELVVVPPQVINGKTVAFVLQLKNVELCSWSISNVHSYPRRICILIDADFDLAIQH